MASHSRNVFSPLEAAVLKSTLALGPEVGLWPLPLTKWLLADNGIPWLLATSLSLPSVNCPLYPGNPELALPCRNLNHICKDPLSKEGNT